MRFMATASVWWASRLMEPYDMAPVAKRLMIASTGSTSSMGTGDRVVGVVLNVKRPLNVARWAFWVLTRVVYSLKIAYCFARVACCSLNTVSGLKRWYSPSRRHWYSPPQSSSGSPMGRSGKARWWRRRVSRATTSRPIPPMREAVQVK